MRGLRSLGCVALFTGAALLAACQDQTPVVNNTPIEVQPLTSGRGTLITVERGQSIDQIARKYHVSKRELLAANHLKAGVPLKPGSQLEIPLKSASAPKTASTSKGKAHVAAVAPAPAKTKEAAKATKPNPQAKVKPSGPAVIPLDDPA